MAWVGCAACGVVFRSLLVDTSYCYLSFPHIFSFSFLFLSFPFLSFPSLPLPALESLSKIKCHTFQHIHFSRMPSPSAANASGQGESAKRKASDMSAPAKRRAPRACLVCRNRKVRCDVVQSSVPCTNCRLDNATCVLSETNRGRNNATTNDCDASYSPGAQGDQANDIPVSLTFEGKMPFLICLQLFFPQVTCLLSCN